MFEGAENLFKDFKPEVIGMAKQYAMDTWTRLLPEADPLDAEFGLEFFVSGALHVIANSRNKYDCEEIIRIILAIRDDSVKKNS